MGLRQYERRAVQPNAFAPRIADPTHGRRCVPNLLLDQPHQTHANRAWVSGINLLAPGQW